MYQSHGRGRRDGRKTDPGKTAGPGNGCRFPTWPALSQQNQRSYGQMSQAILLKPSSFVQIQPNPLSLTRNQLTLTTEKNYTQLLKSTERKPMFKKFAAQSVGRRINILFRLSMMHLRREMKKMGVGAGDYAILFILYIQDGLSQDELSKRMRVDKSHTARAVANLEKMDLVKRRQDPHEHRIKRVFLGKRAREMEFDFFDLAKNWHETLVKDIDPDNLLIIREGMDQMMKNAETSLFLTDLENKNN
jgi:DNA-binding MarR family transcriptional regulator